MPQGADGTEAPIKGGMRVTRKSLLSGVNYTVDLPITAEQLAAWRSGRLIQDVMPHLSAGQREFLLTGATAAEWDEAYGDDD